LRDIAAEETPAANQRNQCVFHGVRLVNAVWIGDLSLAPATPVLTRPTPLP
jgi:hypothetical protein